MDLKAKLAEIRDSENLWMIAYVCIITYVFSVALLTVLFLAAPLLIQSGNFLLVGVGAVSYNMVSFFMMCHQLPERSFFLFGMQFPVCARCVGTYLGSTLGGMLALSPLGARMPKLLSSKKMLAVMTLPLMVDGVTQTLLYARESSNSLRLATGLMFGFGMLYFFTTKVREKSLKINCAEEDAFKLAVLVNLLLVAAILAFGAYTGMGYVSMEEALNIALKDAGGTYQEHSVYYIAPNAVRNIRSDPYLASYNDGILKDVSRIRYSEHPYGLWAVALLEEKPAVGPEAVFLPETAGAFFYIDAMSGEIIGKRVEASQNGG